MGVRGAGTVSAWVVLTPMDPADTPAISADQVHDHQGEDDGSSVKADIEQIALSPGCGCRSTVACASRGATSTPRAISSGVRKMVRPSDVL